MKIGTDESNKLAVSLYNKAETQKSVINDGIAQELGSATVKFIKTEEEPPASHPS